MSSADGEKFAFLIHHQLPSCWPSGAEIGEARGFVFQTREFICSWMAAYGDDKAMTPLFVEVRDAGGVLLLLLPLCLDQRRGMTILGFLDSGQADYNAAIVFPAAASRSELSTRAFWDEVFATLPPFDVARFDKLPEKVGDLTNPAFALADADNDVSAHGSSLVGAWETVEAGSFRSPKEMRRKQRQLEQVGPVRFVVATDASRQQLLLERLIEQKQRRFEETRVAGFADNPRSLAFLRHATELFAASGHLVLCALMAGDEITAVQWGLSLNGRFYALVSGFEAGEWAKFSCGRLLQHHLVKWLHDHGFTYFDQGVGDEAYKVESSSITIPLRKATIIRTTRGKLYVACLSLVTRAKATPAGERARQLRWIVPRALGRRVAGPERKKAAE